MFAVEDFIDKNQSFFENEVTNILFSDEIKEYYCNFIEKKKLPDLYGKTVMITDNQYGAVKSIVDMMSSLIDLDPPQCFVYDDFFYDVSSHGINTKWLEISCKTISDFTERELAFFIAKELCNIKIGHTEKYEIIDLYLQMMDNINIPFSDTVAKSERYALYKWYRASCFTSDAFGMIACGSIEECFSAILKTILNSQELVDHVNITEYLKQADIINSMNDAAFNDTKLDEKVPYGNIRIKKLLAYLSTGRGMRSFQKYKRY